MSALDRIIPTPRLFEVDTVDLAIGAAEAWERVRHGGLPQSLLVRALFALRTMGEHAPAAMRLDDMKSTPDRPGFRVLMELTGREVVVGAIGRVWQLDIPFVHCEGPDAFAAFNDPGYVKVAWSLRVEPTAAEVTRVTFEVRVDATDEAAWQRFRRYFRIIGPASRFIRHSMLAELARELGTESARVMNATMPGDELLPDADAQATEMIEIAAPPDRVWPWLVQMGRGRAGFYSVDLLDNGGARSAREIHPELQNLRPGDLIPADAKKRGGFEVLRVDEGHRLVLGGLYDAAAGLQLPFAHARPAEYWHVTWTFELEAIGEGRTRLRARARAAYPASGTLHASWMAIVHHAMQRAQLQHLAARVEGRTPRDDWRDIVEGVGGAAVMAAALFTPFQKGARAHWGLDRQSAERSYPGDGLIPEPRWSWTHGVEIDARPDEAWPWIAQIGADRAGFYSYQWLENVAGCELRNAEAVHPEWAVKLGDALSLHPAMPPLPVVALEEGRFFVVHAPADANARHEGKGWVEASWLFFVEPLAEGRCRFISRYRCATSDDFATRARFGSTLIEPVGFAMDRRMLLGAKKRIESARHG